MQAKKIKPPATQNMTAVISGYDLFRVLAILFSTLETNQFLYFDMKAKTPSYSETIKTEVVCPNDTNPMGILQGGRLVQWMDIAAAVCAQTHADGICVTASIDKVDFYNSAKVGEILTIKAKITRAFNSSMEIMVSASARNVFKNEPRPLSLAYFTFVAIDDRAKKRKVPPVMIESEEDASHYALAGIRKERNKTDSES